MGQSSAYANHCQTDPSDTTPAMEAKVWSMDLMEPMRIADMVEEPMSHELYGNIACVCCESRYDPTDISTISPIVESLHYSPSRFEVSSTFDIERSQARYAKVSKVRYGCHRRGRLWEDWQHDATAGLPIILLSPFPGVTGCPASSVDKIPAKYFLDRGLTELTLLSTKLGESMMITILIDSIQLICPAIAFSPLADEVNRLLSAAEKKQAVLVQYVTEATEWHHLCFIEGSVHKKDRCIQALTALLLEKRLNHGTAF